VPTLLNQNGFKFFFYANEHEPMHIHVMKGDGFAKISLEDMRVVYNAMKESELKKAMEIAKEHRELFIRRWHEWFR